MSCVAIFDGRISNQTPDFLKLTVPHFKVARSHMRLSGMRTVDTLQNIICASTLRWNSRIGGLLGVHTVEDMDIAVRAHLNGWKFIFLNDVKVLCELPESYEAYKKQQHRWHSGPMHLFRLCLPAIISSKMMFWKKANLILLFFLLRKSFPFIVPTFCLKTQCRLPNSMLWYPACSSWGAHMNGCHQEGGSVTEPDLLAVERGESKAMNHPQLYRGTSDSGLSELNKLMRASEAGPKPPVKN
ncbi:unnamed protein product [Prunus armeniaca]|uniref:Glycosyltransferase 2-like domain-containing protein n=1 Tax=Prunus armeniaca TaxID=36596 RepID=A0A6J5UCC5_PRUAR|nr:unnamed protein product [Prunus armeniaca]